MPRVFIPPLLRPLTGGVEEIDVQAATVREAVEQLNARFPGLKDRLCEADALKPGLSVAVDGNISALGLLQKLGPTSEVHFLPSVGGG